VDESRRADSHCRRIATSARTFVAWFSVVLALPAIAATPGVLVIHSNQRPTPAAITIEDTLRTAIPAGLKGPVEIYSEYLDSEWTSVQAYGAAEAEFLREKYAPRNIGIIMAAAPAALQFTTAYRDRLFPGVPIVHIAMPRDTLEQMKVPADVVGKTVDLDPLPTLKLALRLHPDANHIVFVVGAAERDRVWEQRLREAAAKLGDGVAADYLIGLPTSELTRRLVALPPRTVVFSPGYFSDGTGQVITPRRSMELIAQASRAPVYGALDTFMGIRHALRRAGERGRHHRGASVDRHTADGDRPLVGSTGANRGLETASSLARLRGAASGRDDHQIPRTHRRGAIRRRNCDRARNPLVPGRTDRRIALGEANAPPNGVCARGEPAANKSGCAGSAIVAMDLGCVTQPGAGGTVPAESGRHERTDHDVR
jgi:hypothetical protein